MADKIDRILDEYVAQGDATKDKLLGVAFVVVSKNGSQILYKGAAGRTNLPVDSSAFAPDSFTWVASLTKIVTITCVMQVVERGLIGLDDDVRPLVPDLAQMRILWGFADDGSPILEDNVKPITLRHLLTHTCGLGYDLVDPDLTRWSYAVGRTTNNLSYTLEGWRTPLKFPPGEGWYYGSAIDWAGQVLETVTGQGLGAYMAEHICKPLGLCDTTFRSLTMTKRAAGRTVPCSFRDSSTGTLSSGSFPVPVDPPIESGGAGLWTTAEDHVSVLQALLKASSPDEKGGLVSRATVDEMFRPQLNEVQRGMLTYLAGRFHDGIVPEFPVDTRIDHGLGGVINTEDVPGKRRKGSMMWQGMCNAHWWIDRETGIAATLIVNVFPQPDSVVVKLYNDLELAVYGDLVPSKAAVI
ncbi:beta-lactamase/transpeptidase-like protein [Lasiosphaeria miniovina]|uniref:Beta-lactamase/transpeptidase-like protein n=1 Tax=Lasiosphaeria miniovina TaxID=1954250 RepID=A0AA40ACB6_9PEZI|nr:beta-lactamase/transpeptidase-like protein [Lasiosphaeria miniovina]KAK0713266.1 beta-lactamase/transpeptidase-like protein [Lasiosphaeria miniovina]